MSKGMIVGCAVGGVLLLLLAGIGAMYVTYSNQEVRLRNQIEAKLTDNKNEFDNMWKKISQVAQVSDRDRKSLQEIFNSYAEARAGQGGANDGALMRWVQESIPNVNPQTMANLQNIITSSRDAFTMRPKELIDYKREHDNLRTLFPSSIFVGSRPEIRITVVTSERTEETFRTGQDNDVSVFPAGQPAPAQGVAR
jgi:hypothetical protein